MSICKACIAGLLFGFSGITSNPSESTNASIAKFLNRDKVSMCQFAHAFYFLSNANIVQIVNGYRGFGEFQFNSTDVDLRKQLQFSATDIDNLHDVISEENIETLVFEGKYRDVSLQPNLFVDPRESKTMQGMAKLIIARGKLTFDPLNRCFHVGGLDKKRYTVELGNNVCSCGRKKECSHRLAVKWSCGLPAKNLKFEVNEVFNLESFYKFHKDRKTGKKCGPLKRIKNPQGGTGSKKSKVSNKNSERQSPEAENDETSQNSENEGEMQQSEAEGVEISSSDEEVPLQSSFGEDTTLSSSSAGNSDGYLSDNPGSSPRMVSQNQSLLEPAPNEFPKLPRWTEQNELNKVLFLNEYELTMNDLYSIRDEHMTRESVIAYLKYICDDKANVCIFYHEIVQFITEKRNWSAIKHIFILKEEEPNFWALGALRCELQIIEGKTLKQ